MTEGGVKTRKPRARKATTTRRAATDKKKLSAEAASDKQNVSIEQENDRHKYDTDNGDKSVKIIDQLENMLADQSLPAQAQATVMRTLAEIHGLIGKHARPHENTADLAPDVMSRAQLRAELVRLKELTGG
ncbi:MAG: hypothetical protein AAGF55_00975 [Pseudomonadota bacterium]